MVDTFFRIQDSRAALPERSRNYWTGGEAEYMDGVSAFGSLHIASRDLLGRDDVDGLGICYADSVEEDGGTPVLSVFAGEDTEDEAQNVNGYAVEADRSTERRFTAEQVLRAWKLAVVAEYPEEAGAIDGYDWDELAEEFNLTEFEEDAVAVLLK